MVHICSFLTLGISVREDIRKRSIYMIPIIILTILGICFKIRMRNFSWMFMFKGVIPGMISVIISKFGGDCIGMGDSLLLMSIGILEGMAFCIRLIIIACGSILMFSMIMMGCGKLHRKSQVACVPFLMLGYIGAWLI